MPARTTRWLWPLVVALAVGCGGHATEAVTASVSTEPGVPQRPVVVVRAGEARAEVGATRWSDGRSAADGTRPVRPIEVGPSDWLVIEQAPSDLVFTASLTAIDGGPKLSRSLTRGSDGVWRLDAIGATGTFDVALFGQGGKRVLEVWVRWQVTG